MTKPNNEQSHPEWSRLGTPGRAIEVVPYDPAWPALFDQDPPTPFDRTHSRDDRPSCAQGLDVRRALLPRLLWSCIPDGARPERPILPAVRLPRDRDCRKV
jgi:hypothetical protein